MKLGLVIASHRSARYPATSADAATIAVPGLPDDIVISAVDQADIPKIIQARQ